MLRALSVTAPVVAAVMIVVLLVEPPALRPAERLPTLRMLTEGLDQKRVHAADPENATAQFNLGVKYATGQGVPQDYVLAHMWLNLAASRATLEVSENAARHRNKISELMTPTQIGEAQRLAREWITAHPR